MEKRLTIREILLSAVAYQLHCSEECLKRYKTWQLKEMAEKFDNEQA